MRTALMFFFLALAWLLWSGLLTPLLLTLGLASAGLSLLLAVRMGCLSRDVFVLHVLPQMPGYLLWLFKELVKSTLHVARTVLSPRMRLSPRVVQIDVSDLDTAGIAILGNSITLTPGAATIHCDGETLHVHCLTRFAANDVLHGGVHDRVARLMQASGNRRRGSPNRPPSGTSISAQQEPPADRPQPDDGDR